MTYKRDVTRAKALVTQIETMTKRTEEDRWLLAELTYDNTCSINHKHALKGCGKVSLREWGDAIGLRQQQVKRYRDTWDAYGSVSSETERPSMAEAMVEVRGDSRSEMGYKATVNQMPPAERAKEVVKALGNPEVAREVREIERAREATRLPAVAPAERKATEAARYEETRPHREWAARTILDGVSDYLDEAAESLRRGLSEDVVTTEKMVKIEQAHERFMLTLAEARLKVSG